MLSELARMSQTVGSRVDYVQGGGGNTSVKLDGACMAIKASGYRLSQLTPDDGFAVVETATLKDVTAEKGYPARRPSVETGFHALLGRFVLHTHPVYANLALCSRDGLSVLQRCMSGIPWVYVPYINPGKELCDDIQSRLTPETRVLFLQNHGLVVTGDTADQCLRLHEDVNVRVALEYGVTFRDFDVFSAGSAKPLYPDQQVYLTLTETQQEIMTAVSFIHAVLFKTGRAPMGMNERAMDFIAGWESEAYRKTILS